MIDASYDCYLDSSISLHLGTDYGAFLTLSKKQSVTADSTTVAEYIATHITCQKLFLA
jgi:hypothetical protein